jgi:hypothetical protein
LLLVLSTASLAPNRVEKNRDGDRLLGPQNERAVWTPPTSVKWLSHKNASLRNLDENSRLRLDLVRRRQGKRHEEFWAIKRSLHELLCGHRNLAVAECRAPGDEAIS